MQAHRLIGATRSLRSLCVFQSLIKSIGFDQLVLSVALIMQAILGIPSLNLVGEVGDRIESLPPRAFGIFCPGLTSNQFKALLGIVGHFPFLPDFTDILNTLLHGGVREDLLVVLLEKVNAVPLGSEKLRHLLVLGKFLMNDAESFFDEFGIKGGCVVDPHGTFGCSG